MCVCMEIRRPMYFHKKLKQDFLFDGSVVVFQFTLTYIVTLTVEWN